MSQRLESLERLARLKAEGLLTDQEFEAEKALILSGEAQGGAGDRPSQERLAGGSARSRSDPAADVRPDDGASPVHGDPRFRLGRVHTAQEAFVLIQGVWAGALGLIAAEFAKAMINVGLFLEGADLPAGMSLAATLTLQAIVTAVSVVLLSGLAWWTVKRRSFLAATLLLVLGLGALAITITERFSVRGWPLIGQGLLTLLGVWFVAQSLRGLYAGRRFGREALVVAERSVRADHKASRPKSASEALQRGRRQTKGARRIIGYAGGAIVLVLIVALVLTLWRWRQESQSASAIIERMGRAEAAQSAPPPVDAASSTPGAMDQQYLVGWWVPEGGFCASGAAFELRADGQKLQPGAEGTWALMNGRLRFEDSAIDMDTDELIGDPYVEEGVLTVVNQQEFSVRQDDREVVRYRRCSESDDTEPWDLS